MPDEKFDEKEMEKREEKIADEKWRNDPLSAVIWAIILIWAGLVFLAANLGWLENILSATSEITGIEMFDQFISAWPIVLAGAGVILLGEVVIRLLVPAYRRPIIGTLIFALILISIGMGNLINWGVLWAVILIIVGVSFLMRAMRRKE